MYKNQLQELAQRSCFNLPAYSCIREGPDHAPRFKATVNFNGETFESPTFCSTLRQAEHAAAEIALNTLASRGPSRVLAARVLDETGVYKNLLQETAHRAGLKLPVYTTVRSGPGHVPVFSCTVEIAGMTFTGETARTKKQAQKNAAMAAWSALKRLVQHGTPSSSLETKKGSEEQEQVIIARVLASLKPPDLRDSNHSDYRQGRCRFVPVCKDLTPPVPSLYPAQCQSWVYPSFSPEMAMCHLWQQEQLFQLQNRLLMLQFQPAPPIGPPILPFMQSTLPPDSYLLGLAREHELMPVVPRITISTSESSLNLSGNLVSDPVRGRSTVTIQEINEEKPEESSNCSPCIVPDPVASGSFICEPRVKQLIDEDGGQKNSKMESIVESIQPGGNETEKFDWTSHQNVQSRSKYTDLPVQSSRVVQSFDSPQPTIRHPPGPTLLAGFRPSPSVARPLTDRTVRPISSSAAAVKNNRNMGPASSGLGPRGSSTDIPALPRMRAGVSSYSARPHPQRMNLGGLHPRYMAPAVRIRSVVPVCSAPPARKLPPSTQDGFLSNIETEHTGGMVATRSDIGKPHI
ncbi:hypothetical protein Tsubulata_033138 [Turnera subulata]|uniref:DRBM domain-containing protein n=1 Tax=Turnera subulata TaxID=218843 RepID=A0A9Q0J122_9ROSI|nr:hypothetical protein Tsubulata_033138 [Turnera subulata]